MPLEVDKIHDGSFYLYYPQVSYYLLSCVANYKYNIRISKTIIKGVT